jgi:hypothetical protein
MFIVKAIRLDKFGWRTKLFSYLRADGKLGPRRFAKEFSCKEEVNECMKDMHWDTMSKYLFEDEQV